MDAASAFRSLIDYNYELFRKVWDGIMHLTDEQFLQEIDYSHGSLRNQIVHVAVVDARWLKGLQEYPEAKVFNLNRLDYPTREAARILWDTTATEVTDYVSLLNDGDLERIPHGMSGPVWQVLAHMVNHGTDHRAQILRALHDFGVPTFDQDLIFYLWRR